jgi:hypothetical protein
MSCSDFVQVDPPNDQIVKPVVFSDDSYAESAVTGIYSDLSSNGFAAGSQTSITLLAGLSADDFTIYTTVPDYAQFHDNALTPGNTNIAGIWNSCYKTIYQSNSVIEGLNSSVNVSLPLKNQLQGEAKFLRAFSHFYLTVLFGDVPIVLTTDVKTNQSLIRSPQNKVFDQIEEDLVNAKDLLPDAYGVYNNERIRATKYAASAVLARLYLYTKQWQRAEVESSRTIENSNQYQMVVDLKEVFKSNSKEAIWQLIPRAMDPSEGRVFTLTAFPTIVSLREDFITLFDAEDHRKTDWIGYYSSAAGTFYFPSKYHVGSATHSEYSMVLRLAEQYLIRAEARLKQNKLTGNESAESDINAIRNRSGVSSISNYTVDSMMREIIKQRRLELFAEWGHRWIDLKRIDQAVITLQPQKPFWKNTSILYPLPQYELVNNHNLSQNEGYSH